MEHKHLEGVPHGRRVSWQGKETHMSSYRKPEIALIGNANTLIHGIKNDPLNVDINIYPARHSFELED
jgi:hypothetical protein